ncbi:MAG TPA: hypothetical protein VEY50_01525 [Lysobacter sp.]|nr:hypothetical protein [Lysobacter sp.]
MGWTGWTGAVLALLLAVPAAGSERELRKPPSQVLTWPLPWRAGEAVEYDFRREERNWVGGREVEVHRQGVLRIETGTVEPKAIRQRWTLRTEPAEDARVPTELRSALQALDRTLAPLPLEIRLSADGYYETIDNLDALHARAGTALRAVDAAEARLRSGGLSGADLQPLLAAIGSREALELRLSTLPRAYHFVAGGGLGFDYEYRYEDSMPNLAGGPMLPLVGRMRMQRDALQPDWVMVEWTVTLDRERGGPLLRAMIEKLMASALAKLPREEVRGTLDRLERDLDVGTTARFRIDPATGLVHWLAWTEQRRLLEHQQVASVELTLRR